MVGARLATIHELETVYGVADLYDMLEIHAVSGFNKYIANQPKK